MCRQAEPDALRAPPRDDQAAAAPALRALLGDDYAEVEEAIAEAGELFEGRVVWNVNSTARGGGVAELLHSLLAYARGAGVDVRWVVIDGDAGLLRVTKRIHNRLHGYAGDGGRARRRPSAPSTSGCSRRNAADARGAGASRDDVVLLHDPQTAGLVGAAAGDGGARVVWRCHVGADTPNELAATAWDFLRPYVERARRLRLLRTASSPGRGCDPSRVWIVPPSIDAFSPKNQELDAGPCRGDPPARSARADGAGGAPGLRPRATARPGGWTGAAEIDQDAPPRRRRAAGRARCRAGTGSRTRSGCWRASPSISRATGAHLLLAGPSVAAVADDPEGAEVLAESRDARCGAAARRCAARVHLACLPMDDVEENAAIVNALQRRADVVVQKSLAEGFGLTVAEAMWKARPVVASRGRRHPGPDRRRRERDPASTTPPTWTPSAPPCADSSPSRIALYGSDAPPGSESGRSSWVRVS